MKKVIIIMSLLLMTSFLIESCSKPACGTKSQKKKKMKKIKKQGTFKM